MAMISEKSQPVAEIGDDQSKGAEALCGVGRSQCLE